MVKEQLAAAGILVPASSPAASGSWARLARKPFLGWRCLSFYHQHAWQAEGCIGDYLMVHAAVLHVIGPCRNWTALQARP